MDREVAGYSSWGHKESHTTEQLILSLFHFILLLRRLRLKTAQRNESYNKGTKSVGLRRHQDQKIMQRCNSYHFTSVLWVTP